MFSMVTFKRSQVIQKEYILEFLSTFSYGPLAQQIQISAELETKIFSGAFFSS